MIAPVAEAAPIPKDATFKVAFDLGKAAGEGSVNRQINSAARFLNMHHAAGVPSNRLQLALVVHGSAHRDLLTDEAYGSFNPNAELIALLLEQGVGIYLCGQTAAYNDISPEDLLPGIELSLSAMTTHALLQQAGYTLNPF
jgi:intracellular sulfur oxidation DsrE/DsrF family protein